MKSPKEENESESRVKRNLGAFINTKTKQVKLDK